MSLPDDLYDDDAGQPPSRLPLVLSGVAGLIALAAATLVYQAEQDLARCRLEWEAGPLGSASANAALSHARAGLATDAQREAVAGELADAMREMSARQTSLEAQLDAGARTLADLASDEPRVPDLPPGQVLVEK